jgi:opine dehydrogenase
MTMGRDMIATPRYFVIGAGNGGCAQAAELALRGRDVVLFDYPALESRLAPLRAAGGIYVESRVAHFTNGVGTHFAPLPNLVTDPACAASADIIIVVVPGQHHAQVIDAVLPYLHPGQLVLLNPGGVGGALVWADALVRANCHGVLLAQAADLSYAGFRTLDAKVVVGDKKKRVWLGVFPQRDEARVLALLRQDFPEFALAANVLEAGLQGPGMVVHPLPMLMNAVRIDREAPFTYDAYDITPSVARAVSALDHERMAIVGALGGTVQPMAAILTDYYGVSGDGFFDTIMKVPAYRGSTAPKDFTHRYISEEIPSQIVPACGIARVLGVSAPVMEATAVLAGAVVGEDYLRTGWTPSKLGIAGFDIAGLRGFLQDGYSDYQEG